MKLFTYVAASPILVDIFRLFVAAVLGGAIGWERELRGREAGIRTYMAVAVGAAIFGLISADIGDQGRISSGVVTGMGFIGGGVIVRDAARTTGLTTAATLWASAAVGLSTAYGFYHIAIIGSAMLFATLCLSRIPGYKRLSIRAQRKSKDAVLPLEIWD